MLGDGGEVSRDNTMCTVICPIAEAWANHRLTDASGRQIAPCPEFKATWSPILSDNSMRANRNLTVSLPCFPASSLIVFTAFMPF